MGNRKLSLVRPVSERFGPNVLPAPFAGSITSPRCSECSWAWRDGVMTIKYLARNCALHGKVLRKSAIDG
jgi:hypothetical protein